MNIWCNTAKKVLSNGIYSNGKICKIKYKTKDLKKNSAELTCGTILNCSNTFVIKDSEELMGKHKCEWNK